jgi:hypothetical protein
MAGDAPKSEEWRGLYEAAVRVKGLAPWEWMTEADVFGVQNPETDELGFVSVMGMLGEHLAMSLYLGPEGLYEFWAFEGMGHLLDPEGLLELPQLQASFEDRGELHDKDRKVIKELGLKFRGRNAWPMFRSYGPGLYPWFVEAPEARFLTYALDQLTDVAPRFRETPSLLEPPGGESRLLVRVPREEDGALVWEDRVMDVPPPEPRTIEIEMDPRVVEDLERLPRGGNLIEIDFFRMPAAVREKKARPYFPYMLLMVEAGSGAPLGMDLLKPDPSLEAAWASIPATAADQLVKVGSVPRKVTAGSELLFELLHPLAEALNFELELSPVLPTLHPVKEFLLQTIYD